MKPMKTLLLATMAITVPMTAYAQKNEGVYIGLGGGVDFMQESDISGPTTNSTAEYDLGYGAIGTVGYAFGGGPRTELELGWRHNESDDVSPSGVIGAGTDLELDQFSAMANFLYDLHTDFAITPYVGAGLGAAYVESDTIGSDVVFAYQLLAGATLNVTDNLGVFLDYRYFGTEDVGGDDLAEKLEYENTHHTIMGGLRYSFAAPPKVEQAAYVPPPAPPPPPPRRTPVAVEQPPEVARSYLVFFAFDRSNVTPQAAEIIQMAAENSGKVGVTRIDVTGHTDTVGSRGYNERLGKKRAEAVRAELVKYGIPGDSIVVYSRGETEPLVETPDGVREPQNRRVEIVLN